MTMFHLWKEDRGCTNLKEAVCRRWKVWGWSGCIITITGTGNDFILLQL